ncbi:MAG: hypothetical protein LBI34_00735 [Puniceicoccales bacterium]|nr:hypothetical protein [Puniceicoccales bacterium]
MSAEADGFFFPIFNEAGAKVWDIRSSMALPSGDVMRLQDVHMQLFDEDGKAQIFIGGTETFLNLSTQEINGEEFIHVAGELFTALSTRWKIFGSDKRMVMDRDIRVFFEGVFDAAINGECTQGSDGRYTLITSAFLQISYDSKGVFFYFNDRAEIQSGNLEMTCDSLRVLNFPEKSWAAPNRSAGDRIRQKIDAVGNVSGFWRNRSFSANACEIYPKENVIVFSGNVRIGNGENIITGEKFILRGGLRPVIAPADGMEFPTSVLP